MNEHRPPGRRAANRAAREAFNQARQHGLNTRHTNKLRNLAESGRPYAQGQPARVQSEQRPWERRGPLPQDVREHLRSGVGARIKALRGERGWTQAQLAERIGWALNTVARIEQGVHRPTHRQLAAIGKAFAPRRELARLLANELTVLASPHVRGRAYRGVPSIAADAAVQEARLSRLEARIHSVTGNRTHAC